MNKEMNKEMKNRIEGLINMSLLSDFDAVVEQLIEDLQQEEPFETDDIVKYLTGRMVYRECTPSGVGA